MKLLRKARPTLITRIHATLAKVAGVRSSRWGSRNSRRWTASKTLFHSTRTTKMSLQKLVSDRHHTAMTRRTPTTRPVQEFETSFSRERYVIPSSVATPVAHRLQTDPNHSMAWGRFTFLGRVRTWDGLLALVRVSVCVPVSSVEDP
jgi:hypothetical protein